MRNSKGQFIRGRIVPERMCIKISLSKKGKVSSFKGKRHTKEAREKNRLAHLGKKPNDALKKWREGGGEPWNKGIKGLHLSPQTEFKKGETAGENNFNWEGGITDENEKIRHSKEYKQWAMDVYSRDRWTCQHCGKKCQANNIVAHHNYYFSEVPELRFSLKNGVTLCRSCHLRLHQKNKCLDSIFYEVIKRSENYRYIVGQNA